MSTKWTSQQLDAISAAGSVIVTAAAGSGKTAVLVERVIQKLCNEIEPVMADRLLIVTFTRAAAAEMRQRIEKRLADRIAEEPNNVNLLKQQLLISSADICTIDAFCIKLVRNYFSTLGLSPDFEIADSNTANKIRKSVIEDVFSKHFEAKDKNFIAFLNSTDSVYGDKNAADAVLNLYDFCSTMPQSERWLEKAIEFYSIDSAEKSPLILALCNWIISDLVPIKRQITDCIELLYSDVELSAKCLEHFSTMAEFLNQLYKAVNKCDYSAAGALIINPPAAFPRLTAKKYDSELLARLKACYQQALKWINSWYECFNGDENKFLNELSFCRNSVATLCALCKEFSEKYFEELKNHSLLTFSHVEQLAFSLLTSENESGDLIPSKIAKSVTALYDEVMVDEFQDVNDLQSRLFDVLSDGGKKLFTVGDAKQSIYGFRGANPEHFINKSEKAEFFNSNLDADILKRVVLSKNFRSRKGVCDFINGFFNLIMSKNFGGIDYDDNEMLNVGASYPENNISAVEAYMLTHKKELSSAETEALFLANYIKKTMNEPAFLKENESSLRQAKYGDFAILLRKSANFSTYVKCFKENGIPVSLGYGNFFETTEIMTAVSLLKIVENPLNDIAMLAVMLSPIFGFNEDEAVTLKLSSNKDRFYRAILESNDKKCTFLRTKLDLWRKKSALMPVGDFVSFVLNDSNYNNIVLSMNEPIRRQSNLLLLEELAASFKSDVSGDIGAFVRHLDYIADAAEIKSQSPKDSNSVHLMTVHMSKGLQFPITVLGETFGLFNRKETVADIAFSETLGIAVNPVDDEKNVKLQTIQKAIVNKSLLRKQWEEELRLLYVAMTRAEERLVLLFTAESFKTKLNNAVERLMCGIDTSGKISPVIVKNCNSIGEWLLLYLMLLPNGKTAFENTALNGIAFTNHINVDAKIVELEIFPEDNLCIDDKYVSCFPDDAYIAELQKVLDYKYPFEELRSIEIKTSVSALTKRNAGREFCATARPAFMSSGGLTPTERGTALHKFMQYANFSSAKTDVKSEIERLYDYEYISRAEADAIDIKRVEAFIQSDIFKRLINADKLFREQRFMLAVKAGELDKNLSDFAKERTVIVQGAVDCMFIENDHIVLIDFKTDRTNDENFLLQHYEEQLKIYCHAAEKMLSLPVKECYIYSLHMSKKIEVNFNRK